MMFVLHGNCLFLSRAAQSGIPYTRNYIITCPKALWGMFYGPREKEQGPDS